MPNYIYYENAQIPIFSVLIVLLWAVVSVRIWVFLKTFCGWWSYRGASTIAIGCTAFLCTVYYALLLSIYFINMDMLRVRERYVPDEPRSDDYKYRDPAQYSDDDVNYVIDHMALIIKLVYTARMILTIGLWMIKFSFLFIFLETITALSKYWRYFLYATSFLICATFLIAVWGVAKDMMHGVWALIPKAKHVRNGIGYLGARFIFFDFDIELILVVTNIVTDICLVTIAYQTVHSFRLPLRAVLFPCCLISAGVLVAIGRLVLIILTRDVPDYTTFATIPFELFTELETFISIFVACIPGLRVFVRRRQEMGWRRRSATLATEMGIDASSLGEMRVLESSQSKIRRTNGDVEDVPLPPPSPRRGSVSRPWKNLMAAHSKAQSESSSASQERRIRSDGAVFLSGEEFLR